MPIRNTILFAASLLALGAGVFVASLRGEPERALAATVSLPPSQRVTPAELADWIVSGRRDFTVVDVRPEAAFAAGHVRGAVSCAACHADKESGQAAQGGHTFVDLSKKVVLYGETDADTITLPKVLLDNLRLYRLAGGYQAWKRDILAPVSFTGLRDAGEREDAKRRDALRAFFSGERTAAESTAKLPVTPIRRRSEHKAGTTSEGC